MLEAPIKTIKKSINRNLKKNNVNNFTISQSGDTYIFRHVNQRFLLLYNPNYANAVKISYGSYIIMRDLDKAQKAERQENGYKIANYLIDTYRD